MKKFLCSILAIILMFTMAATAFAAAPLTNENTHGNSTVYHKAGNITDPQTDDPTDDEMEGTYIVAIPEYIEAAPKDSSPVTQNVTATEVLLLPETTLSVACEYSGPLKHSEDSSIKLDYKMQKEGVDFTSNDVVLTAEAGTPTATFTTAIGAILAAEPLYAGIYTDTATFTCTVA